jgi:cation transport protein ChaC
MHLTAELVARTLRTVADAGPSPGFEPLTTPDYEALANELLAAARPGGPVWVFAYGSLIWKPAFQPSEQRKAIAHCWHRTFRLRLTRWRGTPDRPGLMLILDRGGRCRGILQRIPDESIRPALLDLLRREVSSRTTTNQPRWISVEAEGERCRAISFCARRSGPAYTGRLSDDEVADVLATAAGHAGSCAEYLYRTLKGLEQHGIHDARLWSLQAKVAERIAATGEVVDLAKELAR